MILLFLSRARCHPLSHSKRGVVRRRSRLSLHIPRCHTWPVFTSDRPWRVQSSAASEHVAGWWRGGGCGNWEKGQRPKTLSRTSSCFHGLWHPGHAAWNIKTGCQAATNEKSKSLKCICLFLKWGSLFARGTSCSSIRCDLILLNESPPPPSPCGTVVRNYGQKCTLLPVYQQWRSNFTSSPSRPVSHWASPWLTPHCTHPAKVPIYTNIAHPSSQKHPHTIWTKKKQ